MCLIWTTDIGHTGGRLAMRKAPLIVGCVMLCVLMSACSGRTVIEAANATRGISSAGVIDEVMRCAYDALDTMNRGSGC